jgi:hypothetical protein
MKATAWKAFMPITTSLKADQPPDADVRWLASRGIDVEALSVLRCLRRHVLAIAKTPPYPLPFHFLIHGRAEGVPCPVDDTRAFVDLTLYYPHPDNPKSRLEERGWCWVKSRRDKHISRDIMLLNAQSALYMNLIDIADRAEMSDLDMLKFIRQHLHYFANMAQMVIQ